MERRGWRVLLIAEVAAALFMAFANWPRTVGLSASGMVDAGFPLLFLMTLHGRVDYFSLSALLINVLCGLVFMGLVARIVIRRLSR